jgi:drug/metabolite transporter (DMT)-like permease
VLRTEERVSLERPALIAGRDGAYRMTTPRSRGLARGAPAAFVLLWSTGFVGAKYGLPYADPFTFLAIRLAVASALLMLLAAALRSPVPASRAQYGHAAVVGTLLHGGYLAGVFWALSRGVPAGVSAVVVSLQPVLTAVLARRLLGEHLAPRQWGGLALGLGGVALVLAPGLAAAASAPGSLPAAGLVACLVALASATGGTLYQKRHGDQMPMLSGTALQYAAAAALLLVAATATEPMHVQWTREFVVALAWLVLPLSLGAVLLLFLLLRRGTAAGVSSLLYLVPPAVAVEAFLLFGERLRVVQMLGVAVVAVAVALVVAPVRRPTG